jgi:hypothetical protein
MKKSIHLMLMTVATLMMLSCGMYADEFNLIKKVDTSKIKLGMSKLEVETALKKKPENIVSAFQDPNTKELKEVVQYNYAVDSTRTDRYLFNFTNDKLESWELGRPYRNRADK